MGIFPAFVTARIWRKHTESAVLATPKLLSTKVVVWIG